MWEIREGDALAVLRTLPDEHVQCVVTSPPYWRLRDYQVPGQLGLEATPEEYVAQMVEVFREVRRVLRDDGTLWLNMGDGYTSGGRATFRSSASDNRGHVIQNDQARPKTPLGLKPKDLIGMPWRLAFALQADGWWLRSDIIWAKPNPMPESVTDRPTKAHEYVFLMTKSERYYYDQEAVREPWTDKNPHDIRRASCDMGYARKVAGQPQENTNSTNVMGSPSAGRNLRTVWTIPTGPFPGAHFATFPRRLVLPCILAGTSAKGRCPSCGAPWQWVVDRSTSVWNAKEAQRQRQRCAGVISGVTEKVTLGVTEFISRSTTGWQPTCRCPALFDPAPCRVLDPFCGSGTVGVVAMQLGREFIGIELNPEYCGMAIGRILQSPDAATPTTPAVSTPEAAPSYTPGDPRTHPTAG